MNINKAFKEGNLNKWLYNAINDKIGNQGYKIWSVPTQLMILILILVLFLYNINYFDYNNSNKGFKELLCVVFIVFCLGMIINIFRRLHYCILFSREYRKFYEITDKFLIDVTFEKCINQIQYDKGLARKKIILDILSQYFLLILKIENVHGDKAVERTNWAKARENFSEAYHLYGFYRLIIISEGWTPYKKKAEELLAQDFLMQND